MGTKELERLLWEGIAAARAGQKEQARELLLQALALDEETEAAWLWLSGVVDDSAERQICLENVLALNPDNKAAQNGLRWLKQQAVALPVEQSAPPLSAQPETPRPVLQVVSDELPGSGERKPLPPPSQPSGSPPAMVDLDPYGCPYCGGPVSGESIRCDHCGHPVAVRHRKSEKATAVGWLVPIFILLGVTAWLEGLLVAQSVQLEQLPEWLNLTFVKFMVGSALFSPEGAGGLAEFANVVTLVDYVLAALCVVAAVGLALRSRAVYVGSFLLAGVLAIVTVAGLLTRLTGWLPALVRLGLVALAIKWLADSSPAFEWEMRHYNADVDQDLNTDLDYYNRGRKYYDQRMWAKAAAHWKVAAQLAPGQVQYRAELANAYVRMGYPAAALAEVDKALARTPDDEELRAFRTSLADLEAAH